MRRTVVSTAAASAVAIGAVLFAPLGGGAVAASPAVTPFAIQAPDLPADSYGSPTAATDLSFFASSFGGPTPSFEQWFPQGQPGFPTTTVNGQGTSQSGPAAEDGDIQ